MSARIAPTLLLLVSISAEAHQPVMDMAPRWSEGLGIQLRHEFFGSDRLQMGRDEIDNAASVDRYVRTTWLEGVYTEKRERRYTFKLPYVEQERTRVASGNRLRQTRSGFGDLVLAMPLKHYRNRGALTDNFGFTPSLRIPTGDSEGDYPISDGSWDLGLSVSYSVEDPYFYQLYDLFYWINGAGDEGMREGNQLGLDINWGIHPYHSNDTNSGVFLMLDIAARRNGTPDAGTRTNASAGDRIHVGPILVLYRQNVMFRAGYRLPAYEDVDGVSLSRGNELDIGIGMTF